MRARGVGVLAAARPRRVRDRFDVAERVEVQLESQLRSDPQFVECDRSDDRPNQRYTCRVETSADRLRYVATCPSPGQPCVIRRTADVAR